MSELRRIDDGLPRSACSSSPFLFFLSYFLSFFPLLLLPFFPPIFRPINQMAGVKLLFISDRDLGNGGEPPIDQGEGRDRHLIKGIDRNENESPLMGFPGTKMPFFQR